VAPDKGNSKVKFLLDNWMLVTIAILSATMLFMPMVQGAVVAGLDPNAAVQLMNREKAVVVDVCEPAEFAAAHIAGAKNIPLGELEAKLAQSVKNKALPVILVCQSGARSARAVATAKKLGFENAQSLAGGLKAWTAANFPVEKA
jgi:rhodanese-related sulfurtransferase